MNSNRTYPTTWAALPVLLAGAFMVVLDFFIVNVALPAIATDLGAGDSSLEWVVAGYGLAFAALLITGHVHHPAWRRASPGRAAAPGRGDHPARMLPEMASLEAIALYAG